MRLLWAWRMDPAITLPLVATGLIYGAGVRRCRLIRGPGGFPRSRVLFFGAGLAVTYVRCGPALQQAIDGLACKTAVHVCYGYGIQANIDWKASLGQEWRQYERILPSWRRAASIGSHFLDQ